MNKTETYKDNLGRKIIADYFNGNVQWGLESSNQKRVEPIDKFITRVERDKWIFLE